MQGKAAVRTYLLQVHFMTVESWFPAQVHWVEEPTGKCAHLRFFGVQATFWPKLCSPSCAPKNTKRLPVGQGGRQFAMRMKEH